MIKGIEYLVLIDMNGSVCYRLINVWWIKSHVVDIHKIDILHILKIVARMYKLSVLVIVNDSDIFIWSSY